MGGAAYDWALGGLIVAAAGLLLGFVPLPLLVEVRGGRRALAPASGLAGLAVCGGLAAYAAGSFHTGWWTACGLGIAAACLLAVLATDAAWMIIPDLYPLALLVLALIGPLAQDLQIAALGAGLGGGLLLVVREGFRRWRGLDALGLGDVKLIAAVGALVGPKAVLWVIMAGALVGIVWALASRRRSPSAPPLAPFGAAAALPAFVAVVLSTLAA